MGGIFLKDEGGYEIVLKSLVHYKKRLQTIHASPELKEAAAMFAPVLQSQAQKRIPMIALFPNTPISKKNHNGKEALNKNNLICKALRLIKKRSDKFHARFSAKQRIYKYIIFNQISSPVIEQKRGWHVRKPLDIDLIKKGAKQLIGTNDYSTFRSSSCHAKSPVRTIKSIKIRSSNNKIEIEFRSQSFLQQQVRSMVGCLKYIGEKKWDLKKFDKVIKFQKRENCAPPAPAKGLFLRRVFY